MVYIRKPDRQEVRWNKFLNPFSQGIWFSTIASVILMSVMLHLTYDRGDCVEKETYSFRNTPFLVCGLLCQQGIAETPSSVSCRVVFITTCMIAVLLLSNYSATLISFLTLRTDILPFTDLQGLLKDGTYMFGTTTKSVFYYQFKDSNDTFIQRLYEKTMATDPDNFPELKLNGLQRVCSMKYGFLTNYETAMAFEDKLNCEMLPYLISSLEYLSRLFSTRTAPIKDSSTTNCWR
ncbi:hypothetical protein L9F63_012769 [Diploptera punctata]|uniref:Ionotropic glutamate receptor C-terminal domain-containing protein n=1 Tax=Diploptera punctata TaxID=6984 RepID=A0AAD8EMW9_DIPPU|nr:hypothetical protein L9F63_012769 [Diploptera punctata]